MTKECHPRFMLAAAASGSGKTLITCGILKALKNRGKHVSAFKCGPDYIDPMFHEKVLKTKSRNLDTFFTDENTTRYLLARNAAGTDISVIEGVMGFYDGLGGTTVKASAYDLAGVTKSPVVLILDTSGMGLSAAAILKGFLDYRPDSEIRGVILNRMSPMLYPKMKNVIQQELGIQVYGYVPKVTDCVIESRHLGLVMPQEVKELGEKLEGLAHLLEETLDLDGLLELSESAPPMEVRKEPEQKLFSEPLRIGLARDEAFCFIYEDNLQLLRDLGGELVEFSPVHDKCLPEKLDGLLLYGGYPELYAGELSANDSMREDVKRNLEKGLPCMAECGGFLYLHETLEDMEGHSYPMAGVIEGRAYRTDRLGRFGYISLEPEDGNGWGAGIIRAHEFHYYDSTSCGACYRATKPVGSKSWECIHRTNTLMAGFPHLYYYSNPKIGRAFLERCRIFRKDREDREQARE